MAANTLHPAYAEIPRFRFDDPELEMFMHKGQPVVITGSKLVSALLIWTPDYLVKNAAEDALWTVFESDSNHFRYWTRASHEKPANDGNYDFTPPTRQRELTFSHFFRLLRAGSTGTAAECLGSKETVVPADLHSTPVVPVVEGSRPSEVAAEPISAAATNGLHSSPAQPRQTYYLQSKLTESVGPLLAKDFVVIDWESVLVFKLRHGWGPLTTNMLLVGGQGVTTPAHFDEQENIFAQLAGRKRVILFGPDQYDRMYPFPLHHPCDRQSQVDIERPDFKRFPRFADAIGCECTLNPGELLYIPSSWWHHVVSLDETVSINFWFKAPTTPAEKITFPLSPTQEVALTRNIERFISQVTGPSQMDEAMLALASLAGPGQYEPLKMQVTALLLHVLSIEDVNPFLRTLCLGRYGVLPKLSAPVLDQVPFQPQARAQSEAQAQAHAQPRAPDTTSPGVSASLSHERKLILAPSPEAPVVDTARPMHAVVTATNVAASMGPGPP